MENASNALLIAAGVLIGLMILSLGISLYSSLSEYVGSAEENMVSKELQQFNNQFVKYINYDDDTRKTNFTLTIQDIVTVANTAYENNLSYELTEGNGGNNYYVTIKLDGKVLENDINLDSAEILLNGLGKQYRCSTEDVIISTTTGRVYEVNFHEYTEP